eukprot:scaffold6401_cov164-Ochromonas_danica.AAC.9
MLQTLDKGWINKSSPLLLVADSRIAVASIASDVLLQVEGWVIDNLEAVIAQHSEDRVETEEEVRLHSRRGGQSSRISHGRANDEISRLAQVVDTMPEPGRVNEHVACIHHSRVAHQFVQPRRRVGAILADHVVGGEEFGYRKQGLAAIDQEMETTYLALR